MALDNGYHFASHAPPTPTDTPSRDVSQRASRNGSSSPFSEKSHTPFAPGESFFSDMSKTESIASLSNPRFSQNLDISFIGEIHSLKKELERRDGDLELARRKITSQKSGIGELEEAVDMLVAELTQVREESKTRAARERSLEQSKNAIREESNAALEGLLQEKNTALQREADARKIVETERSRKRALESSLEDAYKVQEQERQRHNIELRNMDKSQHILESRLKTMVAEFRAVNLARSHQAGSFHNRQGSVQDPWSAGVTDSPGIRPSSRTGSRMSNRTNDELHGDRDAMNSRASGRSCFNRFGSSMTNGMSLAEELEGEHGEEDVEDERNEERDNLEAWLVGPSRYSEASKARKIMGLSSDAVDLVAGAELLAQRSREVNFDNTGTSAGRSAAPYTDKGTQVSPPISPTFDTVDGRSATEPSAADVASAASRNQMPDTTATEPVNQPILVKPHEPREPATASVGCQTVHDYSESSPHFSESFQNLSIGMINTSTQTSDDSSLKNAVSANSRLSPAGVPVIAIHPPGSRPSSSHASVVLPPRTKNVACQAEPELTLNKTTSSSMQTEEIRVDKRPIKMPSMIRTKHIATRARSPARKRSQSTEKRITTIAAAPPKLSRRNLRNPPSLAAEPYSPPIPSIGNTRFLPGLTGAYPDENDTGPLTTQSLTGPRRPVRSESILAGFDDRDDLMDVGDEYSDGESNAAPPIRKTLSKIKDSWSLVPQPHVSSCDTPEDTATMPGHIRAGTTSRSRTSCAESQIPKTTSKTFHAKNMYTSAPSISGRPMSNRHDTLESSALNGLAQRSRSPSEPNTVHSTDAPPFPVPTRSSSRRIPMSASDGAGSPSAHTTSFFSTRHGREQSRPPKTRKILRKVQSAAAVDRTQEYRRGPPPPPVFGKAYVTSRATSRTRRPSYNQFILPVTDEHTEGLQGSHSPSEIRNHTGEASIEASNQQTTVVDAIAQTMVGEWMWKYIRKRSSFGITENAQAEFDLSKSGDGGSTGGVRHKRWVWLAPYERAVIWSNKQPTSGPALLGKGGRKLSIKSVLDVKDDTPLPKGLESETVFDRSILILTPQRALKFTAISRERHYIWLNALSFLCHSNEGLDGLAVPDPISPPADHRKFPEDLLPQAHLATHRNGQRGSMRLEKSSQSQLGAPSLPSALSEYDLAISPHLRKPFDDVIERPSEDAAEPPQIPRVPGHARKRSSTGPRIPISSFNSYPSAAAVASTWSLQSSSIARDRNRTSSRGGPVSTARPDSSAHAMIDQSGPLPPTPAVRNDFFDAVGTVRMEAFVHRTTDGRAEKQRKSRKEQKQKEHKKNMSYWGVTDLPINSTSDGSGQGWKEDPFRGF